MNISRGEVQIDADEVGAFKLEYLPRRWTVDVCDQDMEVRRPFAEVVQKRYLSGDVISERQRLLETRDCGRPVNERVDHPYSWTIANLPQRATHEHSTGLHRPSAFLHASTPASSCVRGFRRFA